jgi:hypothetical protein
MAYGFARAFAIAAAAAALLGPVAADNQPASKGRPCALVRSIDNYKPIDDRTVIIETSPNKKYLVKFANSCREMKWASFARIESRPGICLSPGDIIVFGDDRRFADRCWISSVTRLPAQDAQSPASY